MASAMTSEPVPVALFPIKVTNLTQHVSRQNDDYVDYWEFYETYEKVFRAGDLINKYYLWVIFVIGFPGNLATVITICRMRRLGPFVLYVALLAIMDNLAISVKLIFYQLLSKKVNLGTAGCRLLEFIGNFLMTYCNWILVLMAVERLIAVKFPFKIQFQSFLSSRKAGIILISMATIIAGTFIPILWASTVYEINATSGVCIKHDEQLMKAIHWTSVILYALVPFTILIVCNILIIREIRLSFRLRSAFHSISSFMMQKRGCDVPIQRQIMLMLFTTTLMFVVLHFPVCVVLLVKDRWQPKGYDQSIAIKYLCQQIAYALCDSNHALNFYLYFLSARKFRSHFKNIFSCSKNGRKRSRVAL